MTANPKAAVKTAARPAPIDSVSEAERAIANLNKIMDRLVATVEQETTQARAGKLSAAVQHDEAKVELARAYAAESERVKSAKGLIAKGLPDALERLRQRHGAFRALLQTNLQVLATAHAVGEGIMRGVSDELARKQAPSTYGASGRTNAPGSKTSQPLAFSKQL
jgi:hypothetical protein